MKADYFFEYVGGLGDVLLQVYNGSSYNILNEMTPTERADIVLCCHNPHADELFTLHPLYSQFILHSIGYCHPQEANSHRAKFGLCRVEECSPNPRQTKPNPIVFFPPKDELEILESIVDPYVVLSASAGMRERDIPFNILKIILEELASEKIQVIAVGRNYARGDRHEVLVPEFPNVNNLIDKLSVPSVGVLVQRCLGTINGHSAINILSWLERKPQLLLLDEPTRCRHFQRKDPWSFGADYMETTWVGFDQFKSCHIKRFLHHVLKGKK